MEGGMERREGGWRVGRGGMERREGGWRVGRGDGG